MATQIGAIKVKIDNKSPKVQTITYGARSIKGSNDISMGDNPQTGYVLTYVAANGNFVLTSATSVIPYLDAGFF